MCFSLPWCHLVPIINGNLVFSGLVGNLPIFGGKVGWHGNSLICIQIPSNQLPGLVAEMKVGGVEEGWHVGADVELLSESGMPCSSPCLPPQADRSFWVGHHFNSLRSKDDISEIVAGIHHHGESRIVDILRDCSCSRYSPLEVDSGFVGAVCFLVVWCGSRGSEKEKRREGE